MTRSSSLRASAFLLAALVLAATSADAQEHPRDPVATVPDSGGAQVMVLGSNHYYQIPEFIRAPETQREIEAVVKGLAEFRPTKVLVEEESADSVRMDSLYRAYRQGQWELDVNERYQLGFRLADRMDLDRVWAIDYQHPWPMSKVVSFARRYDSAYMAYRERWMQRTADLTDSLRSTGSVADMLRAYNSPGLLAHVQAIRMRTMEVDAGGTYVGLEPNISVWKRNMRIFAEIARRTEPGDRVVIVYGAGHAYFFRKWVLQHPEMELVEPADYLP